MRFSKALGHISFKSRISLILVVVSLVSCIVIGVLGWTSGRNALQASINNQLTGIREAQAYQIEAYFDQLIGQTRTLSEDRMIVNAMQQFKAGFSIGLHSTLDSDNEKAVRGYYNDVFMKKLEEVSDTPPLSIMYEPRRTVASYFQYHYMVKNPFPPGRKDMMSDSETDDTIYSKFHRFYQPLFRNLLMEFDFYDIFLIDMKSLSITYSVFKETDFATSLIDGPYQDSALGLLAKKIRAQPSRGEVTISDFRSYAPSYGAPAAFLGAPIYDGSEAIGILAIQIPVDQINKAMTYDEGWQDSGLGRTGETYLVGGDRLMRSDARQLLEDPEAFFDRVDKAGLLDETTRRIRAFETTNTTMPASSQSVVNALDRQSGTIITRNYMGDPVLSSFAPLDIPGLDWVIMAEMGLQEAFAPITLLQRNIIVWGVVLILLVSLLSMLVSRSIVRPVEKLSEGVALIGSGREDVVVDINTRDEFGALAQNFNGMVASIREKSRLLSEKTAENDRLMRSALPAPVLERMRAGEKVADELQQVTVAYLQVTGLETAPDVTVQAQILERIIDRLVKLGELYEVEKIKTVGNTLVFGCGVTRTRLDHSKQTVDFVIAAMDVLPRVDTDYRTRLEFKVGIASGSLYSAIIGTDDFHYEIWGPAADEAALIRLNALPGDVLVTDAVRQKIDGQHRLEKALPLSIEGNELSIYRITNPDKTL